MPTAVISDIHGNAVALKAVLEDIAGAGVSRIICLGDIIGYGPDPLECVDLVRERCAWALMGNHDFGVLYEPTNFNPAAESAAFWTRAQFDNEPDETLRAGRYDFLGRLRVRVIEHMPDPEGGAPSTHATSDTPSTADATGETGAPATSGDLPGVLCVHASPRRPINEYIFPDDAKDAPDKMQAIFDRVERIAMVGHTHVPGVFTEDLDFFAPAELGEPAKYAFSHDEKVVINVGSVGQPRDHDPRAAYAVLHHDRVEFRRVPYDIETTANRIKAIPELHDWLGDRLFDGR